MTDVSEGTTLCERLIDDGWTGLGLGYILTNLTTALVRNLPAPEVAPVIAPAAPSLPEPKVEALPTPDELKVMLLSLLKNEPWVKDFTVRYVPHGKRPWLGRYNTRTRIIQLDVACPELKTRNGLISTAIHEFAHHVSCCDFKVRFRRSCTTTRAWMRNPRIRMAYRAHSSYYYQWHGALRERARTLGWEVRIDDY